MAVSLIADSAARLGHAATGVMIDAALAAAGEYLRRHHGARVAYDTFARAADAALAAHLSRIPPTPDETAGR